LPGFVLGFENDEEEDDDDDDDDSRNAKKMGSYNNHNKRTPGP
jgi:hypothetical protein